MLSDTCFEAITEIVDYQVDRYEYLRFEIDKVKIVLWSLQYYLDTPPFDDPPFQEARERLRLAIRGIDVSGLADACRHLYQSWPPPDKAGRLHDIPPLDLAGILSIHSDVLAENPAGVGSAPVAGQVANFGTPTTTAVTLAGRRRRSSKT